MTAQKQYRVLVALMYPASSKDKEASRHAEPDEVVDDIPAKSVPWLLAKGCIEEVTD